MELMANNSYIAKVEASLGRLMPVSLDALGSVSLMNRIEVKYLLNLSKVSSLIDLLADRYQALEIGERRLFPYSSTYMDTADSLFYCQHVRGQFDRFKIRYRLYESTDLSFLEVKKRTNKGRSIKWRIEKRADDGIFDPQAKGFIEKHSPVTADSIRPVLINRFTRITLAGIESRERITIDFNITFSDFNGNASFSFPWLAIVEFKKESYADSSYFRSIIKNVNAYPTAFSKYCVGSSLLNNALKKNVLKRKLLLIKKLENECN
jgi:hypothetical protein